MASKTDKLKSTDNSTAIISPTTKKGRKPGLVKVKLMLSVLPEIKDKIESGAKVLGISMSDYISSFLLENKQPEPIEYGLVKEIYLPTGDVVLVNSEDYPELSKYAWQLSNPYGVKYAHRSFRKHERQHGKPTWIGMHTQIMDPPDGFEIDHIDGNGLNNTRANLRICSHQQNIFNRRPSKAGKSIYKGVSWHNGNKKWQANITVDGKQINLGYTDSETEAARMHDVAAKIYHGEFAHLNFPEQS